MDIQPYQLGACKFDYEFLGKSVEQLSTDYGFPVESIIYEAEHSEWARKIAPTVLPKTEDLTEFAEQLESVTKAKLSIISLFKQIDNQPMYAQIEKALLTKIYTAIEALDISDNKLSNKLLNLVKAVEGIQSRNPIDLVESFKQAAGDPDTGITVQIMNQIN